MPSHELLFRPHVRNDPINTIIYIVFAVAVHPAISLYRCTNNYYCTSLYTVENYRNFSSNLFAPGNVLCEKKMLTEPTKVSPTFPHQKV